MANEEASVGGRLLGTSKVQEAIDALATTINTLTHSLQGIKPGMQSVGGLLKSGWNSASNWSGGNNGGGFTFGGVPAGRHQMPAAGGGGGSTPVGHHQMPASQSPLGNGGVVRASAAAGLGAGFQALSAYGNRTLPDVAQIDAWGNYASISSGGNYGSGYRQAIGMSYMPNGGARSSSLGALDTAQGNFSIAAASGQVPTSATFGQYQNAVGGYAYGNPGLGYGGAGAAWRQQVSPQSFYALRGYGISVLGQGGARATPAQIANQIFQRTFQGRSQVSSATLNAALGDGGSLSRNLSQIASSAGWDQNTVDSVTTYLRQQNNFTSQSGQSATQYQSLLSKAGNGDSGAQSTLSKYGVGADAASQLRNLNAIRTARTADITPDFVAGLTSSTQLLGQFSQALTSAINAIPGGTAALGGGGAALSQIQGAVGGMSGIGGSLLSSYTTAKILSKAMGYGGAGGAAGKHAIGAAARTGATDVLASGGGRALSTIPIVGTVAAGAALATQTSGYGKASAADKIGAFSNSATAAGIGWSNLGAAWQGLQSGGLSGAWNAVMGGSTLTEAGATGTPGAPAGTGGGGGGSVGKKYPHTGAGVVQAALSVLGTPYSKTGSSPGKGFGCATLTSWAYRQVGVTIHPSLSAEQFKQGRPVDRASLQQGDLVFFYYANGVNTQNAVNHVGIFYQNGRMIHAPHTGSVVQVAPIDWANFKGARRYIGAGGSTSPTSSNVGANSNGSNSLTTADAGQPPFSASISGSVNEIDAFSSIVGGKGRASASGWSPSGGGGAGAFGSATNNFTTAGTGASGGGGAAPAGVTAWAKSLLSKMAMPTTGSNITAVSRWAQQEGGNWHNSAHYNPLNTTQREPGSTSMNGVGVQSYTSWAQGFAATIQTLNNGRYGGILSALKAGNNPSAVYGAIVHSPWGTKNLPGYAKGSFNIPEDHIAQVHKREMILPADIADAVRGAMGQKGGGRGGITFENGAIRVSLPAGAQINDQTANSFANQVGTAVAKQVEEVMVRRGL
jgi:cell wall-associated NlpC family hydrolase